MEALLVMPLVVIVAICAYVIWRGLRRPDPQPGPDGSDPSSLSPKGGGTPR